MKSKRKFLFLVILGLSISFVRPIKESTAKWLGVGSGVVSGTAGGVITGGYLTGWGKKEPVRRNYWCESDGTNPIKINTMTPLVSTLAGIGSGALVGYSVYRLLLNMTPEKRYERAEEIVEYILTDSLISIDFQTDDEIIKHVTLRFGSSWPLVLARSFFEDLLLRLRKAYKLVKMSEKETRKDINLSWLQKKCNFLEYSINDITDMISARVGVIVNDEDYKFQVKHYEDYMKEKRRREHESRERDKDRWVQHSQHLDKMNQKDKDRNFKQNVLQTHNIGNINLNV
ncbi:hypothetical protein ACFLYH_01270 [Candidatus Dependentiae bacterium]